MENYVGISTKCQYVPIVLVVREATPTSPAALTMIVTRLMSTWLFIVLFSLFLSVHINLKVQINLAILPANENVVKIKKSTSHQIIDRKVGLSGFSYPPRGNSGLKFRPKIHHKTSVAKKLLITNIPTYTHTCPKLGNEWVWILSNPRKMDIRCTGNTCPFDKSWVFCLVWVLGMSLGAQPYKW